MNRIPPACQRPRNPPLSHRKRVRPLRHRGESQRRLGQAIPHLQRRAPSPRPTRKLRAKPIAMSRTSGVRASPERLVEGRRIRRDRREDCGAVRLHIVQAGHAVILLANEGGGRYGGTRGRGQERRPHFFRPSDDAEIGVEGQNVLSCCPRARPPASTGPGRAGRAVRRMGTGRPESAVNRGTF